MQSKPVVLTFVDDRSSRTLCKIFLIRLLYVFVAALGYVLFLAAILYYFLSKRNGSDFTLTQDVDKNDYTSERLIGEKGLLAPHEDFGCSTFSASSSFKITEDVNHTARLSTTMDSTVHPCTDFYRYTCGNYQSSRFPNANTTSQEVYYNNYYATWIAFESLSGTCLPAVVQFARAYYDSCVNNPQYPMNPIIDWIEETVGRWPISSFVWHPRDAKISVWSLIAKIKQDFNYWSLVNLTVSMDYAKSDLHFKRYAVKLDYALMHLKYSWGFFDIDSIEYNWNYLETYANRIKDAVVTYVKKQNYFASNLSIKAQAIELINFEMELAKADQASRQNGSMTIINYETLKGKFDAFGWDDLMMELFKAKNKIPNRFIIANELYMDLVNKIVKRTSSRTLYNYVIWQMARGTADLNEAQDSSDNSNCFDKVIDDLPVATNWLYWNTLGDIDLKPVFDAIAAIKTAYMEYFKTIKEVDQKSREAVLKKLSATVTTIGFMQWQFSRTSLNQYYEGLEIPNQADEFSIKLALNRWKWMQTVRLLNNVISRDFDPVPESLLYPNARHISAENYQYLFIGELQPPFYYGTSTPASLLFGSIGFLMAHEFGHAIDNRGTMHGPIGEPVNVWLSIESHERFLDSQKCLIKQYDGACAYIRDQRESYCINGSQVIDEVIADQMGLKLAYKAMKMQQHVQILLNEVVQFTEDQLFFLSFANAWCADKNADLKRSDVQGTHPPVPYRVNLALQNSEEFAQAFQCPSGTPMNPVDKCTVWK